MTLVRWYPRGLGSTLRAMRRLPTLLALSAVLCGCGSTVQTDARPGGSPFVFGRKQVEAAFRRTGYDVLPNLAVLPKGEIADYGVLARGGRRVDGAGLFVYVSSHRAWRAAVADQHGVGPKPYY